LRVRMLRAVDFIKKIDNYRIGQSDYWKRSIFLDGRFEKYRKRLLKEDKRMKLRNREKEEKKKNADCGRKMKKTNKNISNRSQK